MFKEDWSTNKTQTKFEETKGEELKLTEASECKSFYKHRSTSTVDFNEFTLKKELYRKSTRLSSDIIAKLKLKGIK
jgi:hypothetical protein